MVKMEYKIVDSREVPEGSMITSEGRDKLRDWLNQFGEEGWEVDNFSIVGEAASPGFVAIARREKRNLLR